MSKTSIHIQPCKVTTSEAHNLRHTHLDYVRQDLTKDNETWIDLEGKGLVQRLQAIQAKYLASTGQKMQAKATPIREGVVVIDDKTTISDLRAFSDDLRAKWGIRCIQIHIHRDEGHKSLKSGEWKPNLHAHLVFDWTDEKTGKSIKLNKADMAEMQSMLAERLQMQRGQSSDRKHLKAMAFKAISKRAEAQAIEEQLGIDGIPAGVRYQGKSHKFSLAERVQLSLGLSVKVADTWVGWSQKHARLIQGNPLSPAEDDRREKEVKKRVSRLKF